MLGVPSPIPRLCSVIHDLKAATHLDAIEQLCVSLKGHLPPETAAQLRALILAREELASTYLGYESALPHARLPDPAPFCVAVGLSSAGISWGPGAKRTRIVILSVVPASCATAYLGLVRTLAHALRDEDLRSALLDCEDKAGSETWLRQHLTLR